MTYFISGHRDITDEEFKKYYIAKLESILNNSTDYIKFVVGDYYGVDIMAQNWLVENGLKHLITVYHMGDEPMNINPEITNRKSGFKDDIDRDSAMTNDSDFDIAFVREGKIDSGTAQNLMRRFIFK